MGVAGGGGGAATRSEQSKGSKMNILNEKGFIFRAQQILNYWDKVS
jgi:hypothetical protein